MKKLFRKTASLTAAAAMLMSLTACGGTGTNKTTGTGTTAGSGTQSGTADVSAEDRPDWVKPADEVTGKVTVYTTMTEDEQQILRDMWETYYPDCTMEIQADSIGTLVTRVRSDESCDADVLAGGMFAADGDIYEDILQPYTAACDDKQDYHDENGYITFYDVQLMCLVVNPELRDELGIEINGYEDLLQPELEGKIIQAAPDASSSGYRQLQTMLATMGDEFDDEKGWDYISQLIPASFSSTSSKDVFNLVANGEYVVGLSYESAVAALVKSGAPVECVYMEEGNTAMAGGGAITKNAPNLPAAQAVMDIMSSAEFQSRRSDVCSGRGSNSEAELYGLPDAETLGVEELDYDYLNEHRDELINHWNEIVADAN